VLLVLLALSETKVPVVHVGALLATLQLRPQISLLMEFYKISLSRLVLIASLHLLVVVVDGKTTSLNT
jgi:hypothetical protein